MVLLNLSLYVASLSCAELGTAQPQLVLKTFLEIQIHLNKSLGWVEGFCADEDGVSNPEGAIEKPGGASNKEDCKDFCMKQPLSTGCSFNKENRKCRAETWSLQRKPGKEGLKTSLCSLIRPKGLLFLDIRILENYDKGFNILSVKLLKAKIYLGPNIFSSQRNFW